MTQTNDVITKSRIFEKRINFKPFEYPEAIKYKEAIQHSYWLHSEWSFVSDIQDFKVKLTDYERQVVKRALLAISQIEVSVKRFWGKIGDKFPKAEIEQVGAVFSESEVRHADAYSNLLEILGFNDEFSQLLDNPVIQGRVDYLTKYLKGASDNSHENYTLSLTLFAIFIENVSLFSQFLILKSFNKYKNVLKDIDNVVQATLKEEALHSLFGIWLINQIKQENPEWFNDEFYAKLARACKKSCDAEEKIVDWILGGKSLDFLDGETTRAFIRGRFNESMRLIGAPPVFEGPEQVAGLDWFYEEILAEVNVDFFNKKAVTYSKRTKSVSSKDLF